MAREAPTGDPAFRDHDSPNVTAAPIREEERGRGRDGGGGAGRRPVARADIATYAWSVVAVALVGLALGAGFAAGWAYAIPFGVFAAVVLVFFGTHGLVARVRGRRYGGPEAAHRAAIDDSEDSIPALEFGERAEEPGQEPEPARQATAGDAESHADLRRGTGRR